MDTHESLVIGRLGLVQPAEQNTTACSGARPASTYGVSRLGLAIPQISLVTKACARPSPTGAASHSHPTRGTYRMPPELLTRLRDYARALHRYQYVIVTEAVSEYLDRASERHAVCGQRSSWWKVISSIRHPF